MVRKTIFANSHVQATAEANNLAAVRVAKDSYSRQMEQVCGGDRPYLAPESLDVEHYRVRGASIGTFTATRKMGGAEFSKAFEDSLEADIEEMYENFKKHNESKNIFAAARTPAVCLVLLLVGYVISGIFNMLGLEFFATIANLCVGLSLLALCTWLYVRYSGEYRDVGVRIDQSADLVWDMVSRCSINNPEHH